MDNIKIGVGQIWCGPGCGHVYEPSGTSWSVTSFSRTQLHPSTLKQTMAVVSDSSFVNIFVVWPPSNINAVSSRSFIFDTCHSIRDPLVASVGACRLWTPTSKSHSNGQWESSWRHGVSASEWLGMQVWAKPRWTCWRRAGRSSDVQFVFSVWCIQV